MIIDSHVKIGNSFNGRSLHIDDYLVLMEENNIDIAMLTANKPISYQVEDGNEILLDIVKQYPDRFTATVRVDPWRQKESINELDRLFSHNEFKAIYFNPWEENYMCNDDIVIPFLEYAEKYRKPIIIEAGFPWVSHISKIADLARRYPSVNIKATNAGQLDLSGITLNQVQYLMERHKNLYLGTSSAVAVDWLTNMITESGRGRVLFETNAPFTDVYMEIYRIAHNYADDKLKEDVFQLNYFSFLG
ncbi:amidohydrolase family protein [Lentibacillus daqui]|uniref:amidohydrolase family protein n=1 Tax=Lentibacillus daqui TaxID=2911514 RepID=UPI0022B14AE8|nr:amidohydrolase family protein [Lentibacillus daqui]